jgi:hypothetical protein
MRRNVQTHNVEFMSGPGAWGLLVPMLQRRRRGLVWLVRLLPMGLSVSEGRASVLNTRTPPFEGHASASKTGEPASEARASVSNTRASPFEGHASASDTHTSRFGLRTPWSEARVPPFESGRSPLPGSFLIQKTLASRSCRGFCVTAEATIRACRHRSQERNECPAMSEDDVVCGFFVAASACSLNQVSEFGKWLGIHPTTTCSDSSAQKK